MSQNNKKKATRSKVEPPRPVRLRGAIRHAVSRLRAGYMVAGIVAACVVQTWFTPGRFVAAGDIGPFLRHNAGWDWAHLWNHRVAGTGASSFEIARAPEILSGKLVTGLGFSDIFAQRMFTTVVMVAVTLAVCYLASAFSRYQTAIAIAGISATLSPFYMLTLPNLLPTMTIGVVAMIGGLIVRTAQGRRYSGWQVGLVVMVGCEVAFNPPLLVIVIAGVAAITTCCAIFSNKSGRRRVYSFGLRATGWTVVLNMWWIFPLTITNLGHYPGLLVSAQTSVGGWEWAQRNSGIFNVLSLVAHWAWGDAKYHPESVLLAQNPWRWLGLALPALALSGPLLARGKRRRVAWVLAASIAGLAFIAKGINAPLGELNRIAYKVVPGFWLFRQPMAKFGVGLVIVYAVAITLTIDGFMRRRAGMRVPVRRALEVLGAAAVIGALVFSSPIWTGKVVPTSRPGLAGLRVNVPDSYRNVADIINSSSPNGKVLTFPLDDYYQVATTWGYYGVDNILTNLVRRPVLNQLPGGYYANPAGVTSLLQTSEQALSYQNHAGASNILDALDVGFIVVRHDLDHKIMATRTFADDTVLAESLNKMADVRHVYHSAQLDLYSLDARPRLRADVSPLSAGTNRADGVAAIVATAGSNRAVLSQGNLREGRATGVTERIARTQKERPESGVYWDTPAGQVTKVFQSSGGEYNAQVLDRGPVLYKASLDVSGTTLRLQDASGLAFNSTALAPRPDITLPIKQGEIAGFSVDGEILNLAEQPLVNVAPGTELAVYGPANNNWTLATRSPLGDCNNKDRADAQQAGLVERDIPDGVALEAAQHSACVSIPITTARSSRLYQVNFEYRNVSGTPARVCLYQRGPNTCAVLGSMDRTIDGQWRTMSKLVTVDPATASMALYLYADGGNTTTTHTEYRNVNVAHLSQLGHAKVTPEPVPQHSQRTPKGLSTFTVTGDSGQSVLGAFGPVADCNRKDSKTSEQAGLKARIFAGFGSRELRATQHAACVSAPLAVPAGVTQVELSFAYKTVAGSKARICLYQVSQRACAATEPLLSTPGWHSYRAVSSLRRPDGIRGANDTQLFLYADGDGRGTVTQYKNITANIAVGFSVAAVELPVNDTHAVSRDVSGGGTKWSGQLQATSEPVVAVLAEASAPGWSLSGLPSKTTARRVVVDGYANGWYITRLGTRNADITIQYGPEKLAIIGLWVSFMGLAFIIIDVRRRRRKAPAHGQQKPAVRKARSRKAQSVTSKVAMRPRKTSSGTQSPKRARARGDNSKSKNSSRSRAAAKTSFEDTVKGKPSRNNRGRTPSSDQKEDENE